MCTILLIACFASVSMSFGILGDEIPKYLSRKLKRDAARIAIRMESADKAGTKSITIPQEKADDVYNILVAIYESGISEASTVLDCDIRAATDIAVDRCWIIYDKSADWAKSIAIGDMEASGDVGDILDEFDLIITDTKVWKGDQHIITIESGQLYNMAALSAKFKGLDGIVDVMTHNSTMKPDTDIKVSYGEKHHTISFEKKWSSLGNQKSHIWKFQLDQSKTTVEFSGESGDEMPDWMRCQKIRNSF